MFLILGDLHNIKSKNLYCCVTFVKNKSSYDDKIVPPGSTVNSLHRLYFFKDGLKQGSPTCHLRVTRSSPPFSK